MPHEVEEAFFGSDAEVTRSLYLRMGLIGKHGVYAIINKVNGKIYIGCSLDLARRLTVHFSDLKAGRHSNRYLQSSYRKHGFDSFEVVIVEIVSDPLLLRQAEQRWIDHYGAADRRTGFNIIPDSQHKSLALETRLRMSASRRGKSLAEEHKNNIRLALIQSPRLRRRKEPKPPKPKADPKQTFAKISAALMGHPVSDQTKAAIGMTKVGKPLPKRCVTTVDQRIEVRRLAASDLSYSEIGRKFGISRATVRNIINSKFLYEGRTQ